MTTGTRSFRRLHRSRRLLVLAFVGAAAGFFALADSRPVAAAAAPPDLTADVKLLVVPYSANNRPAFLTVTVKNIGGSNVTQPFRVALIVGGALDMHNTITLPPLAAGAGWGATFPLGNCLPQGAWLAATVYVDVDDHIDEGPLGDTIASNQKFRMTYC